MTANGQPDNPRAARLIIKDFISGKLLYVHSPPGTKDDDFHNWPPQKYSNKVLAPREIKAVKSHRITTEELDNTFFNASRNGVHTKGEKTGSSSTQYPQGSNEKPWKQFNRHANKKKREKLRRVYAHLDQH
ncbi:large subunit gtpase 1 -related [Holotrichia oblita]|uniref:Large subunit gtpase 1 -related n=1 Tax=Holotrichia oblita TaxID=644536 RepID=A0ACB9TEU9_HOLOL|nr:large subunit gtpase 1 -related [Holotrichia oblita]